LLCYFIITFLFVALCLFIVNSVHNANELGKSNIEIAAISKIIAYKS